MTFSDTVFLEFSLDYSTKAIELETAILFLEFSFEFSTEMFDVRNAVFSVEQEGLSTYLAPALDVVRTDVFQGTPLGSRSRVLIYVTNDVTQDSFEDLSTSIEAIKALNVNILAVGVGNEISVPELNLLTSNLTLVESYSDLLSDQFTDDLLSALLLYYFRQTCLIVVWALLRTGVSLNHFSTMVG